MRHDPRPADLDGDGNPEWVYLDWVRQDGIEGARFGWCDGTRHASIETPGQAEELHIFDLFNDGKHEVIFGGNTCCGSVLSMAIAVNGRVKIVERPNGQRFTLLNGLQGEDTWTVYGCYMEKGGALAQVIATPQNDELHIEKTWFDIRRGVAHVAGTETYTIPDSGKKLRGRDVSESLAACIEVIEIGG